MNNYLLQTTQHLRHYEEVMLYGNLLLVSEEHLNQTVEYLQKEYSNESLNYPFVAPKFDPAAARWASKLVYTAAQLMLYRENKEADINKLLAAYDGELTPSVVLSADLVLRFLPHIIAHLKVIDPEDQLIKILENHLLIFHYSGIAYSMPVSGLNFTSIIADHCTHQLYVDRVIENKRMALAKHTAITSGVKAALGIYADIFWKDFKHELKTEDEFNR
jgi:hypothetical protein